MFPYLWSKLGAAAALQFLWVLQCLPPNTLSAKAGDKANDKVTSWKSSKDSVRFHATQHAALICTHSSKQRCLFK